MSTLRGEVTLVDLTDDKNLMAYIASTNRRQVIYDPNMDVYFPDYSEESNVLYPELYVAGNNENIINQAKTVTWTVQTNSIGRFDPVEENLDYSFGNDHSLVIKRNVLADNLSMLYRVQIIYTDATTGRDITIQADMELVKLTNGSAGSPGTSGDSSYVWVRYSQNSDGSNMTPNPAGAIYMGVTTTLDSNPPSSHTSYQWTRIAGEPGDDGQTSYTHFAWIVVEDKVEDKRPNWQEVDLTGLWYEVIQQFIPMTDFGINVGDWLYFSSEFNFDKNLSNGTRLRFRWERSDAGNFSNSQSDLITQNGAYNFISQVPDTTTRFRALLNNTGREANVFDYRNVTVGKIINFSNQELPNATHFGVYTDFNSTSSGDLSQYSWTKIRQDEPVLLTVDTPNGTSIRNSEGTLTLTAELFSGLSNVNGSAYKWYKRVPSATGDADSGSGWDRLTSTNSYGTSGFDTKELTLVPDSITGSATYMVIVSYKGSNYRRQQTVSDITDPYSVAILGDSTFKNGRGTNTYLSKVYQTGDEVDIAGYKFSYLWNQYTSSGQLIRTFAKAGKEITIDSDEHQGKADLRVSVFEKTDNLIVRYNEMLDTIVFGGEIMQSMNDMSAMVNRIAVTPGEVYVFSNTPEVMSMWYLDLYGEDGVSVDTGFSTDSPYQFVVPDNIYYVHVAYPTGNMNVQMTKGSSALPFSYSLEDNHVGGFGNLIPYTYEMPMSTSFYQERGSITRFTNEEIPYARVSTGGSQSNLVRIELQAGKEYTVSGDARNVTHGSSGFLIQWFPGATGSRSSWVRADNMTGGAIGDDGIWRRFSFTFIVPADTNWMSLGLRSADFRLLKLEKGSTATNWVPNKDD